MTGQQHDPNIQIEMNVKQQQFYPNALGSKSNTSLSSNFKRSKFMFYLTSAQFCNMLLLQKPHKEFSWLLKFTSFHFKIKGVVQ